MLVFFLVALRVFSYICFNKWPIGGGVPIPSMSSAVPAQPLGGSCKEDRYAALAELDNELSSSVSSGSNVQGWETTGEGRSLHICDVFCPSTSVCVCLWFQSWILSTSNYNDFGWEICKWVLLGVNSPSCVLGSEEQDRSILLYFNDAQAGGT